MPLMCSSHKVYPGTHFSLHEQDLRFAFPCIFFGFLEGLNEFAHVVSVKNGCLPTKGLPFGFQVAQTDNILICTINLLAIPIYSKYEIVNIIMWRKHSGFPNLSFL